MSSSFRRKVGKVVVIGVVLEVVAGGGAMLGWYSPTAAAIAGLLVVAILGSAVWQVRQSL